MREAGFGDFIAEAPEMTPTAAQAQHCWAWCVGWAPERWPIYAALHEVEDWSLLVELMAHIRRETHGTGPTDD